MYNNKLSYYARCRSAQQAVSSNCPTATFFILMHVNMRQSRSCFNFQSCSIQYNELTAVLIAVTSLTYLQPTHRLTAHHSSSPHHSPLTTHLHTLTRPFRTLIAAQLSSSSKPTSINFPRSIAFTQQNRCRHDK